MPFSLFAFAFCHTAFRDPASVEWVACAIWIFRGLIALFPDALRIVLLMVYAWVVIALVSMDGEVMPVIQ
jgi:hypothetical protein